MSGKHSIALDNLLAATTRRITRHTGMFRGWWRFVQIFVSFHARYQDGTDPYVVIRNIDGALMKVNKYSLFGRAVYWYGCHSSRQLNLLNHLLGPDMVFVDVGANLGEFTLFAAKRLTHGMVLAFEPSGKTFAQLQENIQLNHFDDITTYNCALLDRGGELELFSGNENSSIDDEAFATIYPSETRSQFKERVVVRTFDQVFSTLHLDRLDFMKIDAEGAELPILRGAAQSLERFKPFLLIEINEVTFQAAGYTRYDVIDYLSDFGYQFFHILRGGHISILDDPSDVPTLADIFCAHPTSNYSAR